MSRIALIAGAGALPGELAAHLEAPLVCAPEGLVPEGLAVDLSFHIERLVPFLRALGDRGVTEVALAGAIHRPALDPSLFDRETATLVPGMLAALGQGDDATLRWFLALFEEFGLTVRGLADLAPGLLAPEGVLTARGPSVAETEDATRARMILSALAPVDVGQACVVAGGLCLGIEALYGTDALLADVARNRPARNPARGGVLVKRAKEGQDSRADLPAIGPGTVAAAVAAGLTGISVQAGRAVILRRADTLAAAEAAGLALWAEA